MDFKKYEKELNEAGYTVSRDMVSNSRGDVVGQVDPYGDFHYSDDVMVKVICKAMQAEEAKPKKAVTTKKKKRARDEDGHFKADDPSTPDVNEAWEEDK
jgi:menaquinone-dependent protoporphyrinogen IX oxidase